MDAERTHGDEVELMIEHASHIGCIGNEWSLVSDHLSMMKEARGHMQNGFIVPRVQRICR